MHVAGRGSSWFVVSAAIRDWAAANCGLSRVRQDAAATLRRRSRNWLKHGDAEVLPLVGLVRQDAAATLRNTEKRTLFAAIRGLRSPAEEWQIMRVGAHDAPVHFLRPMIADGLAGLRQPTCTYVHNIKRRNGLKISWV
jgi:hypothetical protein